MNPFYRWGWTGWYWDMHTTSHSWSISLTSVWMSSAQIIQMDWSDIWMDPRPIKALVLRCRDGAQESEAKTLWKRWREAKPEGKMWLGRTGHWWENSIKWIFRTQNGDVNWIDLPHNRALVNEVMNIQVPYTVGNFLTTWGIISLCSMEFVCY